MDIQLTGQTLGGTYISKTYDGAVFNYAVYIPNLRKQPREYALIVNHDGLNVQEAYAAELLADTEQAPACISIGIHPATLPPTKEGGITRNLRMNTYDVFSDKYPSFVIDELIPYLTQKYDLRISESPDMHMVSGGSSGGVSAWNMAWHRPNYFRRVYMSSPSFLSMARGDELIPLIRKCETKPIRVFADYSETEPDDYFGSSFCVAEAAIRALRFANYEVESRYYPGEGHCSRWRNAESAIERMRFLWRGWQTESIKVNGLSPRVADVLSSDSEWEKTDAQFPNKLDIPYTADKGKIYFTNADGSRILCADGFCNITGLELSSDKWRLYIADEGRGCVYSAAILEDGMLGEAYTHAALHHKTDFRSVGALCTTIDSEDRLYISTEIGIQTARSCSLIDVIIDNPNDTPANKLGIGTDGYLYAECDGAVFRRKLNNKLPTGTLPSDAKHIGYYD